MRCELSEGNVPTGYKRTVEDSVKGLSAASHKHLKCRLFVNSSFEEFRST